ncbi:MAG: hypothetical protein A3F72_11135 [Bacteroidetes bacterium RIFCSPLOWO2_12_FULL_35_15]|nr:MAG: hypothetical protein A3F72_11135 [Bacteroidetes bacterium RIFCSPLOWO2_12_FULL_35_15]
MNCPKCKQSNFCKDGIANGRQRYQCKSCSYRYTVIRKSDVRADEIKRMALAMYLEGLGYRVIARILEVNHVTIFYWIKEWGIHAKKIRSNDILRSIEINELHTIVAQKKKTKGYAMLVIDIKNGASLLCWDSNEAKVKQTKKRILVK